ncbi:MAG: hypothetical protein R2882_11265 [Gemmatimonadales bacterium]
MRTFAICSFLFGALAAPLSAQSLRDLVTGLFRFGSGCASPICLDLDSGHGDHYNPAALTGGANLIDFLATPIAQGIASLPISAASGGSIWAAGPDGLPVRTETSSGPVFAERGQTLGRGRMLFSAGLTRFDYRSIRGVPLDGLVFTFPHADVGNDGLQQPAFESDVIEVKASVGVAVTAVVPVISYGLTDRIDISVAVPLIRTSLTGTSEAQIIPFANPTPHHFGTAANPQLRATTVIDGAASGIGDVAIRAKAQVYGSPRGAFAILGDVRLATGNEEDFLGSGATTVSVVAVGSLRRGAFSPHFNAGFIKRGGEFQNNGILATVGFDHLMGRRATMAVDLITEWQLGDNGLEPPPPLTVSALIGTATAVRVIRPTNIPDRRDDRALASIGAKLGLSAGLTFVTNALIPLRQTGLQPNFGWTTGFEYSF